MIELRDTVSVDAPSEAVWRWLEALPEHALEWHPDLRARLRPGRRDGGAGGSRHQAEEGVNLKRLLEAKAGPGSAPESQP